MAPNLLILGGTVEASALARRVSALEIPATLSLAGRVENPKPQPIPLREGGFGGPDGLAAYLRENHVTHVIDATHPFAAQMSRNAVQACAVAGVPLLALTREPWTARDGDLWTHVPSIDGAVAALSRPSRRVFLAIGRMHVGLFVAQPHHFYLLRLVDRPSTKIALPDHIVLVDRGPFDLTRDLALLRDHRIDLVVSKNAGGSGARAKIDAARVLGVEVMMIARPALPTRAEVHSVDAVIDWIAAHDADLGV